MKKFIAFGFDDYYPSGGLEDIRGSFDTIEEAIVSLGEPLCDFSPALPDNAYVVDRDTWKKVHEIGYELES